MQAATAHRSGIYRQCHLAILEQIETSLLENKVTPEVCREWRQIRADIATFAGLNAPSRSVSVSVGVGSDQTKGFYPRFARATMKLKHPESWARLWDFIESMPSDYPAKEVTMFQDFKQLVQKKLANYRPFENIAPVDETLEELARGDISRAVITLPSQHTKSSTTDIFVAYSIGLNPLIRCICATYSQKLARKHSRAVKDMINSPEFEDYFGWKPVFKKDAEDEWELDWPGKSQGSTFLARSVESPALGEDGGFIASG